MMTGSRGFRDESMCVMTQLTSAIADVNIEFQEAFMFNTYTCTETDCKPVTIDLSTSY